MGLRGQPGAPGAKGKRVCMVKIHQCVYLRCTLLIQTLIFCACMSLFYFTWELLTTYRVEME